MHDHLLPDGWSRPQGYSNGIAAEGQQIICVSGQIGWNSNQTFETDEFVGQVHQALLNVRAILASADAGPQHMVRMTWYITDRSEYTSNLRRLGEVYREVMGKNFPPMSVVQVVALIEEKAKVEIEVTAVR